MFEEFVELRPAIKIGTAKDDVYITATKRGLVRVETEFRHHCILENVLYCKEAAHNLLSVDRMRKSGLEIVFIKHGVKINKQGMTILTAKTLNNSIIVSLKINLNKTAYNTVSQITNYMLWHQRLGHIGHSKFTKLKSMQMVDDIDLIHNVKPNNTLCEACIEGKMARLPFGHKNKDHVKRPLFRVHSDVCGPVQTPTLCNEKYYAIFVDDFTHYCVTYLLEHKPELFNVVKDYIAKSQAHFDLKIAYLYCDNGGEYLSNEMKNYLSEKGISYHLTVPDTPQQNGEAERMIRTITEKARKGQYRKV